MASDKLTVGRLIDVLQKFPPDAQFQIGYEDFATGRICGIEFDGERNEVVMYHDMTGWSHDHEAYRLLYGDPDCDKLTAER